MLASVLTVVDTTVLVVLTIMVLAGVIPLLVGCYEFAIIGFHSFWNHYEQVQESLDEYGDLTPRTAIIVPAWNEAAVIGLTVDRLLSMDYPKDCLAVYVVDDGSTDETPEILRQKEIDYPGQVFHLRRDEGGGGKSHALNHGIELALSNPWCEALLIIDADVLFERFTLRKMARHLSDPQIGAVTAYIKEGSRPANYMARFIGYEYITAQAAARRAQNVLGAMACLAGGAQLHKRESLEKIGGRIDTSSLAEDTFTTFLTQLAGYQVMFDGNATVWAEEPANIVGLWKQRLRWARGNIQMTRFYKHLWFRPSRAARLGSVSFGIFWFTIMLMPMFMICASVGLVLLYFSDSPYSWELFRLLWITNAITYLFITLFSLWIDPQTARRVWFEGFMFPGLVALLIIAYTCFPPLFETYIRGWLIDLGLPGHGLIVELGILFAYIWLSASMIVAWFAKWVDKFARFRWLSAFLVYITGYGPLLCAITFSSYIQEARGAEMKWDKTEKTGKVFG